LTVYLEDERVTPNGEPEAVFGKDSVTEVEDMRDVRKTSGPETDGRVELAEDFYANAPFTCLFSSQLSFGI